jgi:hypothetical protein
VGKKSDPKINRKLLLTSFMLWPRYATSSLRSRTRLKLQAFEIQRKKTKPVSQFHFSIPSMEDSSRELAQKGYLFLENFLDESSYKVLLENWPKKRWLEPLHFRQNGKSYDSGLRWNEETGRFDDSILNNPAIYSLYKKLKSIEFCDNLTAIANDGVTRKNFSLLLTQSYSHSYLTPHQDSMGSNQVINNSLINVIYFVEANGRGWEAGGTSIFADATFAKPLLIPQNLNNSVLLYRTSDLVWHGFPKIKFRKFRKTLLAHYWCTES